MRKLAHIEKITSLSPIEGADRIEVATVLGWQCVVKKGEFKVGDLVIYIEVDSVMPPKPEYEFLKDRNYRIKTIKLKGQVSQGLVLPINIVESYSNNKGTTYTNLDTIGYDVTDLLGITKYVSPSEKEELYKEDLKVKTESNRLKKFLLRYKWFRRLFLSRKQKSGFPYWVQKTDEERIQNIPKVLEQFKDKEVYVTEKVDYQSGTWTGKLVPRFNNWFGIKMFNLIIKLK